MPTLAVGAAEEAACGRRAEQVFGVGRQAVGSSFSSLLVPSFPVLCVLGREICSLQRAQGYQ